MTNLSNQDTNNNDVFAVGNLALISPEQLVILDMGEVSNLSCHISPLCRVLNKAYMSDVINHLVRAHKAQQEVS